MPGLLFIVGQKQEVPVVRRVYSKVGVFMSSQHLSNLLFPALVSFCWVLEAPECRPWWPESLQHR